MARWTIQDVHTAAEFAVRHMMITFVRGHFKNISGTLDFDAEHPERASAQVEFDAASLWSGEPERDDHLRSEDFLHVARFPKMSFRSTKVEPAVRSARSSTNGPSRIFGPARSTRMAIGRPAAASARRTAAAAARCDAGLPCDRLIRATSMPAAMSSSIRPTLAEPIVHTSLVRRMGVPSSRRIAPHSRPRPGPGGRPRLPVRGGTSWRPKTSSTASG